MKKDFQKVVKMFRDTLPDVMNGRWTGNGWVYDVSARPEYPKAMMTSQQMAKGTATVNIGCGKQAQEEVEDFQKYEPFVAWCESYGIKTITVEHVGNAYGLTQTQIRVTF